GRVWSLSIDHPDGRPRAPVDHPDGRPRAPVDHPDGRPRAPVDHPDGRPRAPVDHPDGRPRAPVDGREAASTPLGCDVEVWLGPEKRLPAQVRGRRVFLTSDPKAEREVLDTLERAPHRVALDVRLEGRLGERPTLSATTERGGSAEVLVDAALARAD